MKKYFLLLFVLPYIFASIMYVMALKIDDTVRVDAGGVIERINRLDDVSQLKKLAIAGHKSAEILGIKFVNMSYRNIYIMLFFAIINSLIVSLVIYKFGVFVSVSSETH